MQQQISPDRSRVVLPASMLALLMTIVVYALGQSAVAVLAGKELKDAIPIFEKPIADAGKAIGAALTSWIPVELAIATPFGPLNIQKTVSYTIYEWFKLPVILVLTTFGMTLLRNAIPTRWLERTLGRDDLLGALGGTGMGMLTPVCSCTVTNLYAGLVAGGASRRASAAFLFASPALNEFAIIFMFIAAGPVGGVVYLIAGIVASLATAYLAPVLGLDSSRFVQGALSFRNTESPHPNPLIRANRETWALFRKLLVAVLISGVLAGLLVNFNLTLVESMQAAGAAWWGPIMATVIGLPLDINAASTAPILLAIRDFVPLGTLVAAMMATTVSSIPEVAMLHKLMGWKSTARVIGWYGSYVIVLGLLLNLIFA